MPWKSLFTNKLVNNWPSGVTPTGKTYEPIYNKDGKFSLVDMGDALEKIYDDFKNKKITFKASSEETPSNETANDSETEDSE